MPVTQAVHSHTLGYDELKAGYIRAQFATEDYYSDAEIEIWLRQEERSRLPDFSRWELYAPVRNLPRYCRGQALELLLDASAPHAFEPVTRAKWDDSQERAYVYCSSLDPYKVQVYKAMDSQAVVYFKRADRPFAVTVTSRGAIRSSIDPEDVFHVLMDTWMNGGKFADRAQAFICNALYADIEEAQTKLEESFDKSVAATADGTNIVHVDKVVFYSSSLYRGAYHIFPPNPFYANKLLLQGPIIERAEIGVTFLQLMHPKQASHLEGIVKKLKEADPRQLIIRTREGKNVLFCHHNSAPSPLPEGGIERPAPKE